MYLSSLIFFACGVIAIKPTKTILILASLKLNPFTWTFKFFRDQLEIILHMFWYTKSNAKHGKIKIPDFQIALNSICEEKVYLRTNDITFWALLFMVRPMLIFSIFSITDYINFYGSDSSLTTLTKLFSKTIHKKQSLVSTLTTLIYMKI